MKIVIGIGIAVVAVIAAFYIFTGVSAFSYNFHPFFSSCTNLAVGMTKEEVTEKMQTYLNNPDYKVANGESGKYGWLQRLTYEESMTVVLDKEPWYKLDQHPWSCEIDFKDGVVVNLAPFFD